AASTERTRRCRARRKAGDLWCPGFDVSREVLERLIEGGWTSAAEASDPQKLSDAVADLVDCWSRERGWPRSASAPRQTAPAQ
ncbi:MAG: hypothetical protein ACE10G_01455, partial [Gemmatimonadales bacterium]